MPRSIPARPGLSRRRLLGTAAAAGAGTALLRAAPAVAATGAVAPRTSFMPTTDTPRGRALHLARRASWGATPGLVAEIERIGTTAWIEQQLAPSKITDSVTDGYLSRFPDLRLSSAAIEQKYANGGGKYGHPTSMYMFGSATVARAWTTRRQLLEVMVDVWSNHFNVTCPSSAVWSTRHLFDLQAIRPHALGKFSDLLAAVVKHPAMLYYLAQAESVKAHPNENLGRELLELHTVTNWPKPYTEADVAGSSRILTGLTTYPTTNTFRYDPTRHWVGPVSAYGFSSANATAAGGYNVSMAYLYYLARHRHTAYNVCSRLLRRFVRDAPPWPFVTRLADVYQANDTSIAAVLRAMFADPEFWAYPGQKLKTPYEDVISTVRVLGTPPPSSGTTGFEQVYWTAARLGQPPMGWPFPSGYPDTAAAWRSPGCHLGRWNVHMDMAAGWAPTATGKPNLTAALAAAPTTHGALVDALAQRYLFTTLTSDERAAVLDIVGAAPSDPVKPGSPAAGYMLPRLVAALLDSPYHVMR